MNNSKSDETSMRIFLQAYNKNEINMLLQKVQNDYFMLDEKIKELLSIDIIDVKGLEDVVTNFSQAYSELKELAGLRNKKIEELLMIIK